MVWPMPMTMYMGCARMNQLGLKLKGSNGEKISIITMGNGQDWVATASSLEEKQVPHQKQVLLFLL